MKPQDIPQELIDLLDLRAGKKHSRSGVVVATLAEILTRYEEIRDDLEAQGPQPEAEAAHERGDEVPDQ